MWASAAIARGTRPSRGQARYVGRVGALAFALGVGAAVLVGAAEASADVGDSGATQSGATTSHSTSTPGPRTHDGPAATRIHASFGNHESAARTGLPAQRSGVKDRRAARKAAHVGSPAATRPAKPAMQNRFARALDRVPPTAHSSVKATETATVAAAAPDRTVVASGLNSPVDFQFLPDGRIVVAEKGGKIKIIDDGTVSKRPLVRLPVLTQGERGINGIAVDPNFATNGYLYVSYTTWTAHDRLARMTVVGARAVFGSQKVLLQTTDASAFYHRGGGLGFGPDGKLYWGVGDNKNGTNAQNPSTLHGKIIRINPDGTTPNDNPDLGPGALQQIYASGMRNPFRLSFTPTGQLLVADVGENSFEEINLVTAGGNYGWPDAEGNCGACSSTNPIYTYAHNGDSAAISSVLFYDGGLLGSAYQNKVFFADEVQGWIKVVTCSADFSSCGNVQDFDPQAGATVEMRQAPDGSIYQLTYSPGQLVRITGAASSAELV